jgi:hypothetical protein
MLSWRAVDTSGLVGQSMPIQFSAEATQVAGEPGAMDPEGDQGGPGGTLPDGGAPGGDGPGGGDPGGDDPGGKDPGGGDPGDGQPYKMLEVDEAVINFPSFLSKLLGRFPNAPSNLVADYKDCRIRLQWTDQATNETHYIVKMQMIGGPPQDVKRLGPNPENGYTAFDFEAPAFGIYGVWVEAVNGDYPYSQKSETKGIFVEDDCSPGFATHLEIEGLGMHSFNSDLQKIYCYLSIEEGEPFRIPEGDGTFDIDQLGSANIHEWMGGKNRVLVRIPADEELSLFGQCLGKTGGGQLLPSFLGWFNESVKSDLWDNRTLQAHSDIGGYVIDYRVRPFGPSEAQGVYEYIDDSIPSPQIHRIDVNPGSTPVERAFFAQYPTVVFSWDGKNQAINSFTLYVDGTPHVWDGPFSPLLVMQNIPYGPLPTACGGTYQFQVAANSDHARSRLSNTMVYEQETCKNFERYVKLSYDGFLFEWLAGQTDSACATTVLTARIFGKTTTGFPYPLPTVECNKKYDFTNDPNKIQHIGIDPIGGLIEAGVNFYSFKPYVYEPLCFMEKKYPIPPMSNEEWANFEIKDEIRCPNINWAGVPNSYGTIYLTIKGYFGAP